METTKFSVYRNIQALEKWMFLLIFLIVINIGETGKAIRNPSKSLEIISLPHVFKELKDII